MYYNIQLQRGGFKMLNIEKIDKELSIAKYGLPRIGDANVIWTQIKSNSEVLRQAVKIRRNKSNFRFERV